ncbi:allantoinase AllB [Spelaeicoccus albus]|uniref:allantoinase n=1 Tax=Spelaeicoccus albus TaxID=1280376 RepID=A0A7Z0AAD2_9MICO|nr:allantoinase AllB [Spelaeicoccus albus]NYI67357.1 allantoinase [Spelaeicoccus albus]
MQSDSPEESGAVHDLVARGPRVLGPDGVRPLEVGVDDGVITVIAPAGAGLAGRRAVEVGADAVLMPGLVDAHVHVNEPGRTEWEGFASATRAAAAGGVTTIVDMPLNSIPPTVDVPALAAKRAVARDQVFVDVGFWGGAVPGNTRRLAELDDAGVFGFKCFLIDSGVPEFPPIGDTELERDMAEIARIGSMVIVHAENARVIASSPPPSGRKYASFLGSRPHEAEDSAIATVIETARRTGARAHILHLSSSDALPEIARAKRDGVQLTVETCPHYLTLDAERVPDGATAYKCCPPIRGQANREALWQALGDGVIDSIVSDHSPSTVELKNPPDGDFGTAWGGVSSLQLGLPLIWSEARRRGFDLARVAGWMGSGPAGVAGVRGKGRLAVGYDADFSVFADDHTLTVDAEALLHKNAVTPYDGLELSGVVQRTFVRGREVDFRTPSGTLLRR